jgi:hypothetical protein
MTTSNTYCYTVTSPSGAWLNSHAGHDPHPSAIGSCAWALEAAIKQCHDRNRWAPGHRIEVRRWDPVTRAYERSYETINVFGPARGRYQQARGRSLPAASP